MRKALLLCLIIAPSAFAAEKLTEVTSEVIEAPGMTAVQIADRGMQCIKSSSGNAADKVDVSRDGDTAYAIVITRYRTGLGAPGTARSRQSVIAKDGRFKIAHSDVEQFREVKFTELDADWGPIYGNMGGGLKQAKAALEARSAEVITCIVKPPEAPGSDNW